jgi:hypothetical protein
MASTVTKLNSNNNILSNSAGSLVGSINQIRSFGLEGDYIEMNVFNPAGVSLYSISNFKDYSIPGDYQADPTGTYTQKLIFDPAKDLEKLGVNVGEYIVNYDILRPKIVNSSERLFFIKEISSDRTEIRLSSNNVSNDVIIDGTLTFIDEFQNLNYFKEFYINLGKGTFLPAINIALDENTNPVSILIKLLNPLPLNVATLSAVSVVDKISNTQVFSVEKTPETIKVVYPTLRGPNFDIELDNVRVKPTEYNNLSSLTTAKSSINSNVQSLLGLISSSQFQINTDYTEFSNFIHYSSAQQRLDGFKYKLGLIETYTSASSSAAALSTSTAIADAKKYQYQINGIIQKFDGYENFLYYESSSYSWPKTNSTKPYINATITSAAGVTFYNGQSSLASLYDNTNQDYLVYSLPSYIYEQYSNDDNLFKFINAIGTMFDEIWLYTKAITDLYKAKNKLTDGISKDLVYYALQSMGINAYTDEDGNDVLQYLYGVNPDGTYLPNTNAYQTLVSASNYQIPGQDQQKGIYKRLYHNLPLLLKSKGTTRFIQYLNTIFGVPSTIMSYLEYGGVDKTESTSEYEYDRFTYALHLTGSNTINIPWNYLSQSLVRTGYDDIAPNGIEFRFKAYTTSSNILLSTYPTQSLFYNGSNYNLRLLYTDTGSANSLYSGSVGNFGYLQFTLGSTSITTPTVPIFATGSDNETNWYSVLVQRHFPDRRIGDVGTSQTYNVYIKNNIWGEIGHVASASLTTSTQNSSWYTNGTTLTFGGGSYPFTGSMQEIRIWSNRISESAFNSHVLNPESYEGDYTSSAYNDLAVRFTLGNNLYTYNHSVITSLNSTSPDQNIQEFTASLSNFTNEVNYKSFVETHYADTPNSGYANPVTDKVRIVNNSIYGTQLLPNKSIELQPILPTSKDIHLLDAGLSPQDEINKDIIAQLGSTYAIDDFIGDPTGEGYNRLDTLREDYFKKYINEFNYKDFINLISYFHNSLFKTLKDFTPARTNVATGIVIKPHLLERPNVKMPAPSTSRHNNQSGSIDTLFITASSGGNYNQSLYNQTINGKLGKVTTISDARDFFTGELPSSSIFIHDDFDIANYNPFAVGYNSELTSSFSESIWNVNFNPLLNNVEKNQISNAKRLLTTLDNGNKVTESIQYQDFTDSYARHARPRYKGSTTTSALYNVFSNGDTTFGKTAVINKNTRQFAFFSEIIASGSDLLSMPERSNVYIKYLIDETGSLTELTRRNYDILTEDQKYNLYQVQNIFKGEETINIGLFDNQNPSRQQFLDGNKHIFAGGFKFHPVLWSRVGANSSNVIQPLTYNLVKPKLNTVTRVGGGGTLYLTSSFEITVTPRYSGTTGTYFLDSLIKYIGGGNVNDNINVGGLVRFNQGGSSYNYHAFTVPMSRGQNQVTNEWNTTRNTVPTILSKDIPTVQLQIGGSTSTGGTSTVNTFISSSIDESPIFKVHISQSNTLIASSMMSLYYPEVVSGSYTSEGFYFNGIDGGTPVYNEANYIFDIQPGDIIRLYSTGSSARGFSTLEEYEITSIILPPTLNSSMSFTLNRNINLATVASYAGSAPHLTGSIDKYIISRKIPDETNIVIDYQKQPGQTSAGIVKNINLAGDIDAKLANIVSELKSKIFSTVLIP